MPMTCDRCEHSLERAEYVCTSCGQVLPGELRVGCEQHDLAALALVENQ